MSKNRVVTEEELAAIKREFTVVDGLIFKRNGKQTGMFKDIYGRHTINFMNKIWYVHRLAYFLYNNVWPHDLVVDHIDGNKSNNTKDNLRLLTRHQNWTAYAKPTINSSSKWRGVYWDSTRSHWVATVTHMRKRVLSKRFRSEDEAALAYNYKAQEVGFLPQSFNKVFQDVHADLIENEYP